MGDGMERKTAGFRSSPRRKSKILSNKQQLEGIRIRKDGLLDVYTSSIGDDRATAREERGRGKTPDPPFGLDPRFRAVRGGAELSEGGVGGNL